MIETLPPQHPSCVTCRPTASSTNSATITTTLPPTTAELLQHLSEDELEIAANATYQYSPKLHSRHQRNLYAASLAQRYLDSKHGDLPRALTKLRATLGFRRDHASILNTSTMLHDTHPELYHSLVSTRKLYVAGRDRDGRATYIFCPRRVQTHDLLLTRQAHMLTLEKAIACSRDGTVNAVIDFAGFTSLRQAPPVAVGRDILTVLRDHYVGRVHRIYFVNAPRVVHWLWTSVFAPLAGTKTRDKICFVMGDTKEAVFGELYDADQVPSWMMPGGTWDDESFAMDEYLRLPLDKLVGDA